MPDHRVPTDTDIQRLIHTAAICYLAAAAFTRGFLT